MAQEFYSSHGFDGTSFTHEANLADGTIVTSRVAASPRANETNRDLINTKASAALAANQTFLALAAPTNAETLAQVQRLTKECNALIRLALGLLDTTNGT